MEFVVLDRKLYNNAIEEIISDTSKFEILKMHIRFFFGTSQTHFIFNSKFYNQISGVAMGSSLAFVLHGL